MHKCFGWSGTWVAFYGAAYYGGSSSSLSELRKLTGFEPKPIIEEPNTTREKNMKIEKREKPLQRRNGGKKAEFEKGKEEKREKEKERVLLK